jgi:hypothetical protein
VLKLIICSHISHFLHPLSSALSQAYLLPLLSQLLSVRPAHGVPRALQAVVLAPSRELALQIFDTAQTLLGSGSWRSEQVALLVSGEAGEFARLAQVAAAPPTILICTAAPLQRLLSDPDYMVGRDRTRSTVFWDRQARLQAGRDHLRTSREADEQAATSKGGKGYKRSGSPLLRLQGVLLRSEIKSRNVTAILDTYPETPDEHAKAVAADKAAFEARQAQRLRKQVLIFGMVCHRRRSVFGA